MKRVRLRLDALVALRNGTDAGRIERLAVDPERTRLLYVILHRGLHLGHDVLILPELLSFDPADKPRLSITSRKLDHLPGLHRGEEFGANSLRVPHIRHLPGPIPWPTHHSYVDPEHGLGTVLPEGAVELSDSTAVYATDGLVGTISGVVLGNEGQVINDLIVRSGLFLRRDVLIPISWVEQIDGVQIRLSKSRQEVKRIAQLLLQAPSLGAQKTG